MWLGTISYGAYLWHYPVFIYLDAARTGLTGLSLLAVRFACTFALAAASYYLVERPVMYGTFWRSLKAITPSIALMVATVAVVVVGTIVPATAAVQVQNDHAGHRAPGIGARQERSLAHPVRFMMVGDSLAVTLDIGLAIKSVTGSE